jgi:hypothetical protein
LSRIGESESTNLTNLLSLMPPSASHGILRMELSAALPKDEWQRPPARFSCKEPDGHWDHTWAAFGKVSPTRNKRSMSFQIQSRFCTQRRTKTVGTSRSFVAADRRLCDTAVRQPYLVPRLEHAYSVEPSCSYISCARYLPVPICASHTCCLRATVTHNGSKVHANCSFPVRTWLPSNWTVRL